MLHGISESVQADEIVDGKPDGMLHRQNLKPFRKSVILPAEGEVISGLLRVFE